jgi:hypothetical protein
MFSGLPDACSVIRLTAAQLAAMPTLAAMTGKDFDPRDHAVLVQHGIRIRQELKLQQPAVGYWLVVQGIPPDSPVAQKMPYWVEGRVIINPNVPLEPSPGDLPFLWYVPEDAPQLSLRS